jgi:hypothetical protein
VDTGSGNLDFTIEQILQEKKTFDVSLNFERLGLEDNNRKWRTIGKDSAIIPVVSLMGITQPRQNQSLSTRRHGATSSMCLH